jgi:RecB family exonuclease
VKRKPVDWVAITRGLQRMNLPKYCSYSSIELFRRCPAAWKARYIDRVQETPGASAQFGTNFGLLVTQALGLPVLDRDGKPVEVPAETPELKGAVDAYRNFDGNWITSNTPERKTQAEAKIEIGPNGWEVFKQRYGVEADLAMPLVGYADYVRVMADGLRREVLDLKTSSRMEWRPEWNVQVLLYGAALDASAVHIHLIAKRSRDYGVGSHTLLLDHNKQLVREALNTVAYYTQIIRATLDAGQLLALPRTPSWGCQHCPVAGECVTQLFVK